VSFHKRNCKTENSGRNAILHQHFGIVMCDQDVKVGLKNFDFESSELNQNAATKCFLFVGVT
jgi:hypothetical protein